MALTRSALKRGKHQGGPAAAADVRHPQTDVRLPPAAHWREMADPATGWLTCCRPAGSHAGTWPHTPCWHLAPHPLLALGPTPPAGTWPHTPCWHCVLHDPYDERINFWTHFLPALVLLGLAAAAAGGAIPGGAALAVFGACGGATHLFSALGHLYPDSHTLEKLDHLGIPALIVGTPLTALMAAAHGHVPRDVAAVGAGLLSAAFLPPAARVVGFIAGGSVLVHLYWRQLLGWTMGTEIALYLLGAFFFLRNGGHARWSGLQDHHFLHYAVTAASALHVWYLLRLAATE